ncbi:SDR family NAD(P)-dependent oxidoreductase [Salinibacterium sp. ZJ454]|uniref:SDR family NAD(P)-dependent oxidoreductase n=1 Tax=Salinibacterium sp. ZJ454 TaxID=2708339 RepID=UPI001AB01EFB|nr:SDR family NAD(P)-dependent oxidoreductase [Salinibacterium sp. ZJ454]
MTGGWGSLGRAHALALSARGTSVVVNDLGNAMKGAGASQGPADAVVNEIRTAGGNAVASYADVSSLDGAQDIVATAIETFGQLDAVINNAGTYLLGSFQEVPVDDFRALVDVHLLPVSCPARGNSPSVTCPVFELLMGKAGKPLPTVADKERPRVEEEDAPPVDFLPEICRQHSVSLNVEDGIQGKQGFAYRSKEWDAFHKHARNSIESLNAGIKDPERKPSVSRPAAGYEDSPPPRCSSPCCSPTSTCGRSRRSYTTSVQPKRRPTPANHPARSPFVAVTASGTTHTPRPHPASPCWSSS